MPHGSVRKETLLLVGDLAAGAAASFLALILRFGTDIPTAHLLLYLTYLPLLLLLRIAMAHYFGLYDFRHRLSVVDHVFGALGAVIFSVGGGYLCLAVARLYYAPGTDLSRIVGAIDAGLLFAWFALSRTVMLSYLYRTGYRVRVALIGSEADCTKLTDEIRKYAPPMVEIAEVVVIDGPEGDGPGAADRLGTLLSRERIDQIILAQIEWPQERLRDILAACDQSDAELLLYPNLNLATLANPSVLSLAGLPLVALTPALGTRPYWLGKRVIDIIVAGNNLVQGLGLFLLIAVVIKLTSKGPVLYAQSRVGFKRKPFNLYKFRTMVDNAEATSGPVLSQTGDPRITPVGRFLRNYRLDELPQFWNVLVGEMSLVGPRPEREEFVDQFIEENPLYERRFMTKPGLTGLAQIHGRYDTDYKDKLRYDLFYINAMSFTADVRILLLTIQTVLTKRGAA